VKFGVAMNLFVTIPALNEHITIGQVVRGVPRQIPGVACVEVVVVDDGSTDDTAAEAAAAGATVISHPETRGVGAAFHTALTYVIERRGDLLVSIDADGQFNPADIPALAGPVIAGRADFSTASRFKDPGLLPEMPAVKLWGNRMMSRLVSRLTNGRYYDVSCGMRCYNRRAMLNLNLMGAFTYTQEVFLNLAFKRLRIEEVPIRVRGQREFGESRVASNILGYAVKTSRIIFRAYRDYKPMRFFGGMCLWLLVPAVLLEVFFFGHYLWTGHFTPYKFAGFGGGGLLILSLIALHMGLIGDMLNRHRVYLEELLYRQRESAWRDSSAVATTLPPAPVESTAVEVHPAHPTASAQAGGASAAETFFPGPAAAPPSRPPGQVASPAR
jgi:glycosyltransferase involved in cell wall biosynthesis